MKVVLVYDRVNKVGGAERVLQALHRLYPNAPLFTSVYNPSSAAWAKDFEVHTSFIQNLPFARTNHEAYVMLMPYAFESFDFSEFDVIISVTSAEAKGIITKPHQLHLCYLLTPTRYLWSHAHLHAGSGVRGGLKRNFQSKLRQWDYIASKRPDILYTISKTTQARCRKYYRRSSTVIYPPCNTNDFSNHPSPCLKPNFDYYLVISRLVKYKKVDAVINAFNQLPHHHLIVVGQGREAQYLHSIAGNNIHFKSNLTHSELVCLYQHARALICPQQEDFGLVAVEAQAAGTPVITAPSGGIAEIVIHNTTGVHLKDSTLSTLINTVRHFSPNQFSRDTIKKRAYQFDTSVFINKFSHLVEGQWQKHQSK